MLDNNMMEEFEKKLKNFDHDAEEWTDQLGEQSNLLKQSFHIQSPIQREKIEMISNYPLRSK